MEENSTPRLVLLRNAFGRLRSLLPFLVGAAAVFVGLLFYNTWFPPPQPLSVQQLNEAVAQAMSSATPPPAYSSLVYRIIQPSLVLIQVEGAGENKGDGLGSGIVVDETGQILTSLHVVANAAKIEVFFADGSHSLAEIVASLPENDIAVLLPEQLPMLLVPATLGNPSAMRVGDEVYAVGNPFGLYSSISAGVISGFDRSFQPAESAVKIEGLIQVDAAINPGNSGGPLLNRYGQVIGIVTGIINPTEESFFIGIGFAVPINIAGGAAGMPQY